MGLGGCAWCMLCCACRRKRSGRDGWRVCGRRSDAAGGEEEEGSELRPVCEGSEERRLAEDGGAYTEAEFVEYYGGAEEWERAPRAEDEEESGGASHSRGKRAGAGAGRRGRGKRAADKGRLLSGRGGA